MMGSGKTTVADLVASRIGREVIDTDAEVEAAAGRSISEIFATEGESRFRELERDLVAEACIRTDVVIALGGGAVLDDRNVEMLRKSAWIVLLDAPVEVLAERVANATGRPLLHAGAALADIWEEREARYRSTADATVDATAPPPEVAMAVLDAAVAAGDVLSDAERAALP
ncbi:MAG: shikimate kinase [Actinobacteria bacterium]|nr:shikimate kinase [Actinomycetota bacterium]